MVKKAKDSEETKIENVEGTEEVEAALEELSEKEEIPPFDIDRVTKLLASIEHDVRTLRHMIEGIPAEDRYATADEPYEFGESSTFSMPGFMTPRAAADEDAGIEGAFDGERMIDANGKSYQVPPNYASKSKLVEGDPLKLYITHDGKYVYKQLGPVERRTVPGVLRLEGSHYVVDSDEGVRYNVLTACVTYYMALFGIKEGDRVMIMIPADRPARYAVIDNVL